MTAPGSGHRFDLTGGEICLDFANTLEDRPRGTQEYLHGWPDLVSWADQAGVVSAGEAQAVRRWAKAHPRVADRIFRDAISLRERIYRIFHAVAAGSAPAAADLTSLNDALARAMSHAHVVSRDESFTWAWKDGPPSLERLLWPVARSTAELLVADLRADVRECASATCSWLFLDRSPRRIRRWCSMKTCGNRDKARRFYERHRAGRTMV